MLGFKYSHRSPLNVSIRPQTPNVTARLNRETGYLISKRGGRGQAAGNFEPGATGVKTEVKTGIAATIVPIDGTT